MLLSDTDINYKDSELVYLVSFQINKQQTYRGHIFMLDRWEGIGLGVDRTYT